MSPEQLTGDAVDRRSDLFSCGVILYQLLTGERAFSGSPATVMHKVLHEQPAPPSSVVAALPRPLDAVVRKAMAKAPADRYPDADAFARRCARRSPVPAPPLPPPMPMPRSCCRGLLPPRPQRPRHRGRRSWPASACCWRSPPARPPMSS
jgi:serine/threonine-protein kinase